MLSILRKTLSYLLALKSSQKEITSTSVQHNIILYIFKWTALVQKAFSMLQEWAACLMVARHWVQRNQTPSTVSPSSYSIPTL